MIHNPFVKVLQRRHLSPRRLFEHHLRFPKNPLCIVEQQHIRDCDTCAEWQKTSRAFASIILHFERNDAGADTLPSCGEIASLAAFLSPSSQPDADAKYLTHLITCASCRRGLQERLFALQNTVQGAQGFDVAVASYQFTFNLTDELRADITLLPKRGKTGDDLFRLRFDGVRQVKKLPSGEDGDSVPVNGSTLFITGPTVTGQYINPGRDYPLPDCRLSFLFRLSLHTVEKDITVADVNLYDCLTSVLA